ncbi:hypothetical protein FACS1894181_06290 [Bacteroidia bacterium]|nr:hypothetical protein FACS1894181_06290 [Bacteroidia bacterium]
MKTKSDKRARNKAPFNSFMRISMLCTALFAAGIMAAVQAQKTAQTAKADSILQQTIYKKEFLKDAEKALQMSEQINYAKGILFALDQLGVMQRNYSFYSPALIYHRRCLDLALKNADEYFIMRSYINLGVVYNRMDNYETALDYFQKASPLAKVLKDNKEIASCLGNIGNLYLSLGKDGEAMEYFQKSMAKAIEMNNYQGLAISSGLIGQVYENRGMLDSAMYHYQKNQQYSKDWNDNNGIAISLNAMGSVAKKKNDWKQALDYYQKALEINILINDRKYLSPNYSNIGEVYFAMDELNNAEKYYRQSLETAAEAGLKKNMAEAYWGLSKVFEKQNRGQEAIHSIRNYILMKDSILNEKNLSQIEFLKTSFEVSEKEQTITFLQERLQRRMIAAALGGIILLLIILFLFYTATQRKKLNRVLMEMNATKDKFFNIISHDLKSPAIAQRNALQTLINHAGTWDADALKEFYSGLLHSANSEVELLNNLLNWARVQTGRMPCMPDAFDPASVLQHELNLIRSMAESKGVAFNTSIPGDIVLTADSNMFCTILRNLLTNAVKFTPAGGTVSLSLRATEDGKHTVTVSDTGQGMTDEQLNNLFRIDIRTATGTAGEQGTGLGLIVCKEMLEKHNSTLHIESEEGKGSRFRFMI